MNVAKFWRYATISPCNETMSCVESISEIIITLMHIGHFYEHINPLFSAYIKPHKTGFRIDNIKFVK